MTQTFHDIAWFDHFTDLNLFNAHVGIWSGAWVPMGQGAATAITPQGGRTSTGLPTRNPATSPPCAHPATTPTRCPSSFSCLCCHFMSTQWQKVFVFFPFLVLHGILGVYRVFGWELVFITSLYFHLTLAGKKWSARSTRIAGSRWFRCKKLKQTMRDKFFFLL